MEELMKELLERVVSAEKDVEWLKRMLWPAIVAIATVLAGLYGIHRWALRQAVERAVSESATAEARRKIEKHVDDAQNLVGKLKNAREEGNKHLKELNQIVELARKAGNSAGVVVDAGAAVIEFNQDTYRHGSVTFTEAFPTVPTVLISESTRGGWLIVKVDERRPDGFDWAARHVDGGIIEKYAAKLQWIAIASAQSAVSEADTAEADEV